MSYISIDNIVEYFLCPTKLSFRDTQKEESITKLKSFIFSGLLDYCFYLKTVNQSVTEIKLNQRLNYLWSEIKEESQILSSLNDKLYIKSRINNFKQMFSLVSSTIYYDVPKVIYLGDVNVHYSFFTYLNNNKLETVVKFYAENQHLNEKSGSLRIISSLIKNDLDSLDDGIEHDVFLFSTSNAKVIKCKSLKKENSSKAFVALEKNLREKYFLPRNSNTMCRECNFNKICEWNSLDG